MEIRRINGTATVRAIPDQSSNNQLSDQWVQELLAASGEIDPPVLVVDITGIEQMGPRTMAGLIQTHRRLHQRGGRLVLAGVSAPLADLIQITGFAREITVAATMEEACQKLAGGESPDQAGPPQ